VNFTKVKAAGINGMTGEALRLIVTALLAAILAFFALRERVSIAETTEQAHFLQIQQSLSDLKSDVREIREALRR